MYSIVDGVDGEIARVKHLSSHRGQWLDTICDTLSNLIFLSGVTVGVFRAMESSWLLWCGITAVVLHLLEATSTFWHLATRANSGTKLDFQWDIKRPGTRDKPLSRILLALEPFTKQDMYSVIFMVLALAGVAWLILPATMISLSIVLTVIYAQTVRRFVRIRRLKQRSGTWPGLYQTQGRDK
jgi:phosphatidylglycerophosphate synthase